MVPVALIQFFLSRTNRPLKNEEPNDEAFPMILLANYDYVINLNITYHINEKC